MHLLLCICRACWIKSSVSKQPDLISSWASGGMCTEVYLVSGAGAEPRLCGKNTNSWQHNGVHHGSVVSSKGSPSNSGCFSWLYCDVKRSGFLNCRAIASSHTVRSAVNSRAHGSPGHNWTPRNKFAGSHLDVDKKFKDLNLVFFFYGLIEETFWSYLTFPKIIHLNAPTLTGL